MAISTTSWKKRVAMVIVGLLANEAFVVGFDNVLYPCVIGYAGPIIGGVIMITLSIIVCYGTLKLYDWSGKDWLGLESLKEAKELENSKLNRFIAKFMKKSHFLQLVALSIVQDPFIVTVFLREGAHEYGKMTRKDWSNFWISVCVGNGFWIVTCWFGIAALEAAGAKLEVAIAIFSGSFIALALVGFIVGHLSARKDEKTVQVQ